MSKVTCLVCGKEFKVLINPKHMKTHGMTMAEYREKFPGASTSVDPDYYSKRARKGYDTLKSLEPDIDEIRVKRFREGHKIKYETDSAYRAHFDTLQKEKVALAWSEERKDEHIKNLHSSCGSVQDVKVGDKVYRTKSSGERFMIRHLTRLGVNFEYESLRIKMECGRHYYPDFYIPELNLIIECKFDENSYFYGEYDHYKQDQSKKQGYDHIIVFNHRYEELNEILTGLSATA